MIRGAYGYKRFSEKVGENMYRSNAVAFREAIENATELIDVSKVSKLSSGQIEVLNRTSSSNWMNPLLNRMGELGMMDLREELMNPKITNRIKKTDRKSTRLNSSH